MKLILILIIPFFTLSVSGQIEPKNKKTVVDTIPSVEYIRPQNTGRQPVYYINGELSNPTIIRTIDPQLIDSIQVERKEIEIKGKKYYGQIFLKMKKEYNPRLISLTDIEKEYASMDNTPTVFLIDNEIIKDDYDQFFVDEKFILKIIVDAVESKKEKLKINVIQLLTRTKENIEKSKEIRIRGLDEITLD